MKFFLFVIKMAFFFNLFVGAQAAVAFSYQYQQRSEPGFNLELYQLTQHFEDQNYGRLSAFSSGNIPYLHVDEVLNGINGQGQIFIKMGLLAPENLHHRITELKSPEGSFFVFHTKDASIAFFNIKEVEVKRLVQGLGSQSVVFKTFSQFLISSAFADQVSCSLPPKNSYKSLGDLSLSMENSLLYKRIGECAVTALKGAGQQFEDTAEFFKKFATDPSALWQNVKKSYEGLKLFAMNFTKELQSFYQMVSNLTMDEKLDIACTMIGQVGAGALMSLTGAGAVMGGTKIVAAITPKLIRMKNLMLQFQRLKIPHKAALETLSCGI